MDMAAIGWSGVRPKPSGKWEGRWAIADENHPGRTRVIGKTFNTKDQARTYSSNQANSLLNVAVGLTGAKKDIQEALSDFLGRSIDPKTIALYDRRLNEFLSAFPDNPTDARPLPVLSYVNQISDLYINRFDKILIARGSNPGGRHHVLKIVRTFCRYAMKKKWLAAYPFDDFKMPSSEFEGRALTDEEFQMLLTPTVGRLNQHALDETDRLLGLAFRLGRGAMLRISQVWKLTQTQFREPNLLFVQGIKDQEPEWKPLHGDALTVVRVLLSMTTPGQRFFAYWNTIQAMQNAVQDKVRRSGIKPTWDEFKKRWVYPRFHDACKVTGVSELAGVPGMNLADLANVSNTSAKTLQAHYIKADKARSHEKYAAYLAGRPQLSVAAAQTTPRPQSHGLETENGVPAGTQEDNKGNWIFTKTPFKLDEKTSLDEAL